MSCVRGMLGISLFLMVFAPALSLADETVLFSGPNPDAPEGIEQYGQFVGSWTCAPAARQEDGELKSLDARPTWVWHYALNGQAIQDVWIPDPEHSPAGSAMGTNLRVYDPDTNEWIMVWTTENLRSFQTFTAKMESGNIVMHGEIPTGPHPPHQARITFHNISDTHFDWKYEASKLDDGENWQIASTLSCDRKSGA